MAEVLLRVALPRGSDWVVTSAGTSADPGSAASEFARVAIAECGLNLEHHRSQLVTQELVDASMVIVAMTNRHVEKLFTTCAQCSRPYLFDALL